MDAAENLEERKACVETSVPHLTSAEASKQSRLPKWKLIWIVGVLTIAVALYCSIQFISAGGPHGISRRAYNRIKLGMTKEEVIGVVGLPPGVYGSNNCEISLAIPWKLISSEGEPVASWDKSLWWEGQDVAIWLAVDDSGKVVGKQLLWWRFTPEPDPVWLQWVKRLLP